MGGEHVYRGTRRCRAFFAGHAVRLVQGGARRRRRLSYRADDGSPAADTSSTINARAEKLGRRCQKNRYSCTSAGHAAQGWSRPSRRLRDCCRSLLATRPASFFSFFSFCLFLYLENWSVECETPPSGSRTHVYDVTRMRWRWLWTWRCFALKAGSPEERARTYKASRRF